MTDDEEVKDKTTEKGGCELSDGSVTCTPSHALSHALHHRRGPLRLSEQG